MPTVAGTLRASARRVPRATALIFGDAVYTYADLDTEVDRAARVLHESGLRKGDRFALMSPSSDGFVVAFYAAHRLGAVVVPINPALTALEVGDIVSDSGASILAHAPELAAVAGQVSLGASGRRLVLGRSEEGSLPGPATGVEVVPFADEVAESDDALILYTSGTTGRPKGALFDHHRVMWVAFSCLAACGMRAGDRFLHIAPLYHAADLCIMLVPGTMLGATHVVVPRFDPAVALDLLERERITMCFGVPTMFQALLRLPDLRTRDLGAWRTALFGAAPMPPHAVEQLHDALPGVELMQLCGQTEAGPSGIYASVEQVLARPDISGGQAVPFTEVRVVDDQGRAVSPGETGEMLLRGETVMKGYWGRPDETAEVLRDGWLHTGDVARVDDDGSMTLVDRLKDMIITGGRNVYSVEVENAMADHPDVQDCAVVSRPHPEYGESIVAVVAPREGASVELEDLRDHCAERIARYKLPHDLITAEIPRNPSGKILKNVLRELVAERAGEGS